MKKGLRYSAYTISCLFILFLGLGFTDIPYYMQRGLSCDKDRPIEKLDYIIHFSGNGMPSSDELIRCYYSALVAQKDTSATILIVQPAKEETDSILLLTKNEIVKNNIKESRILFETEGYNTYTQVKAIISKIPHQSKLGIVSSPYHMFRLKKCFEKHGYNQVYCIPTFETSLPEMLLKSRDKEVASEKTSLDFRYNFWNYLKFEISAMREYVAIAYYKFNGWI